MPFDLAYVKQHKVLIGGAVLIGFVGYLYIRNAGSQVQAASGGGIDPTSAALYGQQMQLQAASDAQASQESYGLAVQQLQANTTSEANKLGATVSLANIGAQQDVANNQIAAQILESNNTLTAQAHAIDAQLAGLESNNATTQAVSQIAAQEQVDIANLTSQTQVALSNNTTAATIANINANQNIAALYANSVTKNQAITTGGGLLGTIAKGIFSLF